MALSRYTIARLGYEIGQEIVGEVNGIWPRSVALDGLTYCDVRISSTDAQGTGRGVRAWSARFGLDQGRKAAAVGAAEPGKPGSARSAVGDVVLRREQHGHSRSLVASGEAANDQRGPTSKEPHSAPAAPFPCLCRSAAMVDGKTWYALPRAKCPRRSRCRSGRDICIPEARAVTMSHSTRRPRSDEITT